MLGIACRDGFLEGDDAAEFVIAFAPSINVLIGDRGAGKSTILNLVGLLADSVDKETDVLVSRLLDGLSADQSESPNSVELFSNHARKLLEHYGITWCAVFYCASGTISCFYMNLVDRAFNIYDRVREEWHEGTIGSRIGPTMMILQQGEVSRIAEERDQIP